MNLPENPNEFLLLHNPRCSKSRAVHQLLEERGIDFQARLYLEDPLSCRELKKLRDRLGKSVAEWVRVKEDAYGEAELGPTSSDEEIFSAMSAAPILMERPILIRGQQAVVGRPPEDVLVLIKEANSRS